ncbi:MAG: hypothetical protein JXR61_09165 [Prolixibacteraceae bacterium]|nr:hypothetical protein [Prolixibacteraceae bacterium]
MRLCRQVKDAEGFALMLEPRYNELIQQRQAYMLAKETSEDLYDSKVLKDTFLDDKIRNLIEACNQYDRNHPGSRVSTRLFPDGLTALVRAPMDEEPGIVQTLILKIEDLGPEHELAAHIPVLRAAADASKAAIDAYSEARNNLNIAWEFINIAKSNLNRQYEKVIYAASAKFGKTYAERLFPSIQVPNKKGKKDAGDENGE